MAKKKTAEIMAGLGTASITIPQNRLLLIKVTDEFPRQQIEISRTVQNTVAVRVRGGGPKGREFVRELTFDQFAAVLRKAFK